MSIRSVRSARSLALAAVLALLATGLGTPPATAVADCAVPPPVMSTDLLVNGMTGTGLTTIRGATPTTFEVEVLGVMEDYIWLDVDAIVVRITGPQSFLDQVGGAFYGMSGSPVFVGGRFIGSISYGVSWDPTLAGLTPAQAIVDMLDLHSASGPSALPETIPFDDATRRAVAQATGRATSEVTGGLQLFPSYLGVSGLSAARLAQLQARLDERGAGVTVVPASGMDAGLPVSSERFTAGQPIGSVLSWGDYTIWAAGTVALACADEVVAYGHSLFWWPPGEIEIGLTGVDVLAVGNGHGLWPGDMVPVLTEPRGTFLHDAFAGQSGFVGLAPDSTPITSSLSSLDTGKTREGLTESLYQEDWWFEETVWGHLVLNFGAVQQGLGPGSSALDWIVEGTRGDGSPFTVANHTRVASAWDATESVWRLVSVLDQLIFNPWEPIRITSVDTVGEVTAAQQTGEITRVRTSSPLDRQLRERDVVHARPGDRVTVEVTLDTPEGSDLVHTFTIKVPRHASSQKVKLRAGRDRWWYGEEVGSFDDLLYALNSGEHPDDLVVVAFGRTRLLRQPVVVSGKAAFRIAVSA